MMELCGKGVVRRYRRRKASPDKCNHNHQRRSMSLITAAHLPSSWQHRLQWRLLLADDTKLWALRQKHGIHPPTHQAHPLLLLLLLLLLFYCCCCLHPTSLCPRSLLLAAALRTGGCLVAGVARGTEQLLLLLLVVVVMVLVMVMTMLMACPSALLLLVLLLLRLLAPLTVLLGAFTSTAVLVSCCYCLCHSTSRPSAAIGTLSTVSATYSQQLRW
jgi:hypothetical protein